MAAPLSYFRCWALVLAIVLCSCTEQPPLPEISTIQPTALIDSKGQPFDLSSLKGKVWIANFIFTRCGGPCPRMTAEFAALQRSIGPIEGLHWVSISADPEYDTPEILAEYAARFDADTDRWHFLTGDRDTIHRLAETDFLLGVQANSDEAGLITHSLKFAVIDQDMKIRAYHDHFEENNAEVLATEIDALL